MPAPSETLQHPSGLPVETNQIEPYKSSTHQSFWGKLKSIFQEPQPIGNNEWVSNRETRENAERIRSMLENALTKGGVVAGNAILIYAIHEESGATYVVRGTASDNEDWPVESKGPISIEPINFTWNEELFDGKSFRQKVVFPPDSYTEQPYYTFTLQGGEEQHVLPASPKEEMSFWLTTLHECAATGFTENYALEFVKNYAKMPDTERRQLHLATPYMMMGYFDRDFLVNQDM